MWAGFGRVVAELAAQVPDVDVDDVLVAVPLRSPHRVDELAPGEGRPWAGGHGGEQVELGAGQVDGRAVEARPVGDRVDQQAADRERLGLRRGSASSAGPVTERGRRSMARTRAISSRGENGLTR